MRNGVSSLVILLALCLMWRGAPRCESAEAKEDASVHFTVDLSRDVKPISPFIYGVNQRLEGPLAHCGLTRVGGNRWTAYNWTNNASNAGNDWQFQNDNLAGGGDAAGGAVVPSLENAAARGAGIILTIPISPYVAADKNGGGDVRKSGADYLQKRFRTSHARKGPPFTLTPAPAGSDVYQDEFVNWVRSRYPAGIAGGAQPIWFSLDNEPDLWASTHAEVHPKPATYAEVVARNVEYASAIKAVAPKTKVFGPVSYGWQGYANLQNAPDAKERDFLDFYLHEMAAAQTKAGQRLLDVFDVHWYPEARGGGLRVTGQETTAEVAAARMQAPRSLWDPSYTETSWITQWSTKGPIQLIPRLRRKVQENYPDTELAITEYNFGGARHISGGIAQADVLGIFGREGLIAACEWPMADAEPFVGGAFRMYRDFDGKGAAFGDRTARAETDDLAGSSIYAATDSKKPGRLVLICLNKTDHARAAAYHVGHGEAYRTMRAFTLTAASHDPQLAKAEPLVDPSDFRFTLPAMSVVTLELTTDEPR